MTLKGYLIVAYAILVRTGKWGLEAVEGEDKPIVPEDYRLPVAEYLAQK